MTIGDLAHLGSPGGAQRNQAPQILRGKIVRAPANENDGLTVSVEGYALAFPFEIPAGHWTQRGTALPALGAMCSVILDGRDAWMVGYEGTSGTLLGIAGAVAVAPIVAIGTGTATFPGATGDSAATTVTHNIGRVPPFYVAFGTDPVTDFLWYTGKNPTTTQVTFRGHYSAAVAAGTYSFCWAAIG